MQLIAVDSLFHFSATTKHGFFTFSVMRNGIAWRTWHKAHAPQSVMQPLVTLFCKCDPFKNHILPESMFN